MGSGLSSMINSAMFQALGSASMGSCANGVCTPGGGGEVNQSQAPGYSNGQCGSKRAPKFGNSGPEETRGKKASCCGKGKKGKKGGRKKALKQMIKAAKAKGASRKEIKALKRAEKGKGCSKGNCEE